MKVKQKIIYKKISDSLEKILLKERVLRNFNVGSYLEKKSKILNDYMNDCNLDTCVVALSGGLDSSVTLGIVQYAKLQNNSPIKKIEVLSIPCETIGATNQDIAYLKALDVSKHFNLELKKIEIGNSVDYFTKGIEKNCNLISDPWARGQAVSYFRTSTIYYITSLLTNNNFKPVVIGTTNRDEGAYIGYFGKASDGMVDIQLISDVHKSDLRSLAKFLNIPNKIISDAPTGDMYDGRLDEDVFGVPYDFVELYTYYLGKKDIDKSKIRKEMFDLNCLDEFDLMSVNIENMHKYNGHKYLGCSPSIHLDVMESLLPNCGWKYSVYNGLIKECENPTFGDYKSW